MTGGAPSQLLVKEVTGPRPDVANAASKGVLGLTRVHRTLPIAGGHPALGVLGLGGRFGVAVVFHEGAGGAVAVASADAGSEEDAGWRGRGARGCRGQQEGGAGLAAGGGGRHVPRLF